MVLPRLAGDRLRNTDDPLAAIASSLGYESESAFGKAFKRLMGCSPRRYSRGQTQASSIKSTSYNHADSLQTVAAD